MAEKFQFEVDPNIPLRQTHDLLLEKIVEAHGGNRLVAARAVRISPATITNRLGPKPESVNRYRNSEELARSIPTSSVGAGAPNGDATLSGRDNAVTSDE